MKKLFILLAILLFSFLLIFLKFKPKNSIKFPPVASEKPTPSITQDNSDNMSEGNKIVWFEVLNSEKIFLYSNLDKKLTSKDFATQNNCQHIVNGGFYTENTKHIGQLISDSVEVSPSQNNELFNGYFSISENGRASITTYPLFDPKLALQSGPLLISNGKKINLELKNDENARRVAVAISEDDKVFFIVAYNSNSPLLGPKLEELPEILEDFSEDKKLGLNYILNLDGGAHSAFITDLVTLTELSPAGSFFCIRP